MTNNLDNKYSMLVDELQALNSKFNLFLNGADTATVNLNGVLNKSLSGIIKDLKSLKFVLPIQHNHKTKVDMLADTTIQVDELTKVWGDSYVNNGIWRKDSSGFTKLQVEELSANPPDVVTINRSYYGGTLFKVRILRDGVLNHKTIDYKFEYVTSGNADERLVSKRAGTIVISVNNQQLTSNDYKSSGFTAEAGIAAVSSDPEFVIVPEGHDDFVDFLFKFNPGYFSDGHRMMINLKGTFNMSSTEIIPVNEDIGFL